MALPLKKSQTIEGERFAGDTDFFVVAGIGHVTPLDRVETLREP